MVVVTMQNRSVSVFSATRLAWEVPVEVMRLRVRHARERVGLCCVSLVRHVDGCEGGEKVGREKEEGCGSEVRAAAATKV